MIVADLDETPADPVFLRPPGLPVAEIYTGELRDDFIEVEVVEETASQPESVPVKPLERQIVLLGAGQAHLEVLARWRRRPMPGTRLTLVNASDRVACRGMLGDVVSGRLSIDDMVIDLRQFCALAKINLIVDRAITLELVARQIELAHQPAVSFDVASINIGLVPGSETLWQQHRQIVAVSPLATFWPRLHGRMQESLSQRRDAGEHRRLQLVVVGAGTIGTEVALGIEERIHREDLPIDVHLVDAGHEVWRSASTSAIRRVRKLLKYRGIDLHLGHAVVDWQEDGPGALFLDDGTVLRCDLAVWATTAAPPSVLRGFPLARSLSGHVQVDRSLRASTNPVVFAAGELSNFPEPFPKCPACWRRQGEVLVHNLRASLTGQPLDVFVPPSQTSQSLACGNGTAILDYHGWSLHNRWVAWLQARRNRAYLRQFR